MNLSLWVYPRALMVAVGSVESPNCHQLTFWFDPPAFNWIGATGKHAADQAAACNAKLMFSKPLCQCMQVGEAGDMGRSSYLFSEEEKQNLLQLILDGTPYFG